MLRRSEGIRCKASASARGAVFKNTAHKETPRSTQWSYDHRTERSYGLQMMPYDQTE